MDFKQQLEDRDLEMNKNLSSENIKSELITTNLKQRYVDEILNMNITLEEITKNLKTMYNSKSSGPDGLVYDILKNNFQETTLILMKMFDNIIKKGDKLPWNHSWVAPIYKNGNKDNLSSYRCINLSSCIEKLLTKIINCRLTKWFENYKIINPEQTGFRKGNSVIDNILLLNEIMKIYKNKKRPLYVCFVDLSKAFDSIPIEKLKKKLYSILPDSKLLSLMTTLLDNKSYKVLYDGDETQPFKLKNGIPQGDSLSPTMFCLYINDFFDILRKDTNATDPASFDNFKVTSVAYADDILLMSQSQKGIIKQIEILQQFCIDNGLKINYEKTKIMIRNVGVKYSQLMISSNKENHAIEVIDSYKYLGMLISTKNTNKSHIEYLAKKGRQSSFLTSKMLKEFGQINGSFLRDTFDMLTLSKIKYCGEFCFCDNIKLLNQIQYQFYKRFCHLKITTPNYCLVGEFGIKPVEFHFYKAALNYWLKILVSSETNLSKKLYEYIRTHVEETCHINTWCWKIKNLLYELKLEQLWRNQENINKQNIKNYKWIIKTRLKDHFRELWIKSASHSHKGLEYLELARFDCDIKPYLNFITCDKSVIQMLKLRTGNHTLSVEIDRYQNRKMYNERLCTLCDTQNIQDLYHVIIQCPKFNKSRSKNLISLANHSRPEFYLYLNSLNKKDLNIIVKFMEEVEETIKQHRNKR